MHINLIALPPLRYLPGRWTVFLLIFLTASCQSGYVAKSSMPPASSPENKQQKPAIWPEVRSVIPQDQQVEQRVQRLLKQMTIAQKVAQIIQPEIRDITVADMRRYGFGSFLNGGGAYPNNNKQARISDWVDLAQAMYQASVDDSLDGSRIPTMWGTDAVHGHNNVIGATIFPHNIALGATRDPELIKRIAIATSREVQATGIDWIFAPTVATARDDRWGRTYESYAEDPDIIRTYAHAFVEGLQGDANNGFFAPDNVIATVKHFIGDGGTQAGDDQGNNLDTEQALFAIHGQGYVGGLQAGAQTVMASFNSWQGDKVHGSHYLLTQVLKQKMGFDGLVVGDWNGHGQIPGCSNDNCPQAINAGLDIYMVPTKAWKPLYHNLIDQVQSGKIQLSRLDDAVSRVLRVKIRAGLLDKPAPAKRGLANRASVVGSQAHRDIAREAVRKSLVLLKNNHQLLPLSPRQHVLVAGNGADNIGKQSGGWSITWQGNGNQNSDFPGATSIYQGLHKAITSAGGSLELSESGDYQQRPDVAIVVFGEDPYAEGNGDLANLAYQRGNKTDLQLLRKLKAQGIPVVSLFISGRPLWVNPEINASDAFVAIWLPGSEGQGIADVLLTDTQGDIQHDFTGRLAFSWPNSAVQTVNHGDGQTALFPYGYGLDYTKSHGILPKLDETAQQSLLPVRHALFQGTVKAPWQVTAFANKQQQTMRSSVLQLPQLAIKTTDRRIQEDALAVQWHGPARLSLFSPFPVDYLDHLEQGNWLTFDLFIQRLSGSLTLQTMCLTPCGQGIDLSNLLAGLPIGYWHTVAIPVQCLSHSGVQFKQILSPFTLQSDAGTQLQLSDIQLAPQPQTQFYTPAICSGAQQDE